MQVERRTEESIQGWQTGFSIQLDLGAGLTLRERTILLNSARRCEVYKLLTSAMRFDYGWAPDQSLSPACPTSRV